MTTIYRLKELSDVFADACIRNERGEILFLSLYGRDVGLHQLTAAFHLPPNSGGIRDFHLVRSDTPGISTSDEIPVHVGDPQRLEKLTSKFPKGHLFGSLSHMWVYDPALMTPDKATRSAWIIKDGTATRDDFSCAAWNVIVQLSPIALLPHWRAPVMAVIEEYGQVRYDFEYAPIGDIQVCRVVLATDFEMMISEMVKQRVLTLHALDSEIQPQQLIAA